MKGVWLSVAAVGLLAGQVWADMTLTLNKSQAMMVDTATMSAGGTGYFYGATDDFAEYNSDTMLGQVGYTGYLKRGEMTISATAAELGLTGQSFTGFSLFLANDNDDPWQATLYIEGQTSPAFVSLIPGTGQTFVWDFGPGDTAITLDADTDIGFIVRSTIGRSDVFHMSAVPAPVAVMLGVLGLGVAGLKLRKFV